MGADFRKGDRVRVTFEGTVTNVLPLGGDDLELRVENDETVQYIATSSRHVEKIEPPVETFKPGDLVRMRRTGTLRALGDQGYVHLGSGRLYRYGHVDGAGLTEFTSDRYERVEVG